MKNQGLQRHIVKANFIWDLPDWQTTGVAGALPRRSSTTGRCPGSSPADRARVRHHVPVPEQRREREPDRVAGLCGSRGHQRRHRAAAAAAIGSASSAPRRSRGRCPAASASSPAATTWSAAPTRPPTWRSPECSSLAARGRRSSGVEMYNAFNAVVYNARQTQLQLVSPTNQTIRNSQFLADGTRRSDPVEDDERRVWRGDRRAAAADDPGAAAVLVLK